MAHIDYKRIYEARRRDWKALTDDESDGKYEMLVAGHYSENNHFVYELLQNAEDEGATRIVFDYYPEELRIYHNGKPFDQKDVEAICSFLDGTKDRDSLQKIGHFGLGFKSVFKYTNEPEVYSDDEAFKILRYLLPEKIEKGSFPKNCYINIGGKKECVFKDSAHATMFVLPYKREIMAETSSVKPDDIIEKLVGLEPEILLFLKNITEFVWIDNTTGRHGYYRKDDPNKESFDRSDIYQIRIITCTAFDSEQSNEHRNAVEASSYALFRRDFSVAPEESHNASIAIAYKLNASKTGIIPMKDAKIWVFFPTRDDSNLPFIIHGTYETPVSREKIMLPSVFNSKLLRKTEDLITDSLVFLKGKNWLTQSYIKQVLLPSLDNKHLSGLREKINATFLKEALLPSGKGVYTRASEALVAIPYDLPMLLSDSMFADTEYANRRFIDFSDVNNSALYIKWLVDELHIQVFTLSDFASLLKEKSVEKFGEYIKLMEYLSNGLNCTSDRRSSLYEKLWNNGKEKAIPILKKARIIRTQADTYSAAQDEKGNPILYFESRNDYQALPKDRAVAKALKEHDDIRAMLNKLGIAEFDNKLFVEKEIIPKYRNAEKLSQVGDDEHISDVKSILSVIKDKQMSSSEIVELLDGAYLLKVILTKNGTTDFCKGHPYFALSSVGIDIKNYFKGVEDIYIVKEDFYKEHDVSHDDLLKLGAIESLSQGENICKDKYYSSNPGPRPKWETSGDFRWRYSLQALTGVLKYISDNPEEPCSQIKSQTIFRFLQNGEAKLCGTVYIGGTGSDVHSEIVGVLSRDQDEIEMLIEGYNQKPEVNSLYKFISDWDGKWLYTKEGEIASADEISKHDLDEALYGELKLDSKLYALLGFAEGDADRAEAALKKYTSIPRATREAIFETAWQRGELKQWMHQKNLSYEEADDEGDAKCEFPSVPVKNLDLLQKHVQQTVYCADPVKYEKVLRSIRTSKDASSGKAYLAGMYGINLMGCICQMCQNVGTHYEAVQIQKDLLRELEQPHLCLCPTCAATFRQARNDETLESELLEKIQNAEANSQHPVAICFNGNKITFTQTHLAEIQEILKLLNADKVQKI